MAAMVVMLTVRMIEHFSEFKNEEIQKISKIIEAVIAATAYFLAIFAVLFVGFTLTAHILFGPLEPRFNGVDHSAKTLILWFITLSGGQRALMDRSSGQAVGPLRHWTTSNSEEGRQEVTHHSLEDYPPKRPTLF